jgi:hypothetical protein
MLFRHPFSREHKRGEGGRGVLRPLAENRGPDLPLGEPWQSANFPQTSHTFSGKDPLAVLTPANPGLAEDLNGEA